MGLYRSINEYQLSNYLSQILSVLKQIRRPKFICLRRVLDNQSSICYLTKIYIVKFFFKSIPRLMVKLSLLKRKENIEKPFPYVGSFHQIEVFWILFYSSRVAYSFLNEWYSQQVNYWLNLLSISIKVSNIFKYLGHPMYKF